LITAMGDTLAICIKRVHATSVPLRLEASGRAIRGEEAPASANPADLAALALALSLRAAGGDGRIVALTVGPAAWEEPLRLALAAGAEEAVRLWNPAWPEERWGGALDGSAAHTRLVAAAAAEAFSSLRPALVLAGEASADGGHGCFGALLAHALGAAFAHRAVALAREGTGWRLRVKLERGYTQEMTLPAPAVVTVSPSLPPPGQASLPAWIASRGASIPTACPSLAYPPGADTALRAPVPRVKRYTVPDSTLDAESRIRAMVERPASGGGTLLGPEMGAEAQAEAILMLLAARDFLPRR
jgi:electron transfer flavoprotein beta subunit